ncbi:MAG: M20/M25/M40 family metallo-hydrolase [Bacillota bacterium]
MTAVTEPSGTTAVPGPAQILSDLIRFDTRNPPGNEGPCIQYIRELLGGAGYESTLIAKDPARPNLVCRVKGQGVGPPFLMYGHVDVVPTTGQEWQVPPFEGRIVDGVLWGRGAIDMKGPLAMMISALLRARTEGRTLPSDVVFAALSDEEAGSDYGARFLVEEHPSLFSGVKYGIGEFGAASIHIGGTRLYPIMIAEKHAAWLKATIKGSAGHSALLHQGGTTAALAKFLLGLDRARLPVHVTPAARIMIRALAKALPLPYGPLVGLMQVPALADVVISAMGPTGRVLRPILHNSVNATIIRGGDKVNVVPPEVDVLLDCRLLPGFSVGDAVAEIRAATGIEASFEVLRDEPDHGEPDLGLYETLAGVLAECDPDGKSIPMLFPAITDGRWFSKLGIQTYGFTPMNMPPDLPFTGVVHGADERVPVEALSFGADAIYKLLLRL